MNKKICAFITFIICLLVVSGAYPQEEKITITTYYPAPYGSYRMLKLAPTTLQGMKCDKDNKGLMFYHENKNTIFYCNGKRFLQLGQVLPEESIDQAIEDMKKGDSALEEERPEETIKVKNLVADVVVTKEAHIKSLETTSATISENLLVDDSIHSEAVITGVLNAGIKHFVQQHPLDPSSDITYVSVESRAPRIFLEGQSRIENGECTIILPQDFLMVSSEETPYNIFLQPFGDTQLFVKSRSRERITVASSDNLEVEFGYLIIATRKGFEDFQPVKKHPDKP